MGSPRAVAGSGASQRFVRASPRARLGSPDELPLTAADSATNASAAYPSSIADIAR